MKTPMTEHIEWLKNEHKKYTDQAQKESSMQILGYAFKIDECIKHAESLLEKEKEVMCEFQDLAQRSDFWVEYDGAEGCFDKTFKTKEQ